MKGARLEANQMKLDANVRHGDEPRHPRYKDFPKHDLRRYFALLLAIERLKERATMHYLALELACTRGEVVRAVKAIKQNLMVSIDKPEFAYRITSWGVLNKQAVKRCMTAGYLDGASLQLPKPATTGRPVWTREYESELVELCFNAAHTGVVAISAEQADVFRFVAQLVKTRFPIEAAALERAHAGYFTRKSAQHRRSFPEVIQAGLIKDVSRFRNVMEQRLAGVRSW